MCFPSAGTASAAAPFAPQLAIAAGALSLVQQSQNYSAQKKYQKQTFAATKEAADADALRNYAAIQQRQIQEQDKAARSIQKIALQATEARASARTAAGESGVAGNSVQALQDDYSRDEADYQSQVIKNQSYLSDQFGLELEGVHARQTAAIQSGIGNPIQPPDYLNTVIKTYSKVLAINYNTEHNLDPYAT